MKVSAIFSILSFLFLIPLHLLAQNEIERERISLKGLQEIGFTANIEGRRDIANNENLTPSVICQQSVSQLVEAGIRYVSDEDVQSSADIPFLYMHVNTLTLENGLVPFSIQLRLYQPVKLSLNRGLQTSASTWEAGMVGVVSYDRLAVIHEAARDLVSNFIDDYQLANPNMGQRQP